MAIVEVDHVTKEFRLGQLRTVRQSLSDLALRLRGGKPAASAPFRALDDVSFNVQAGEVLGIIGHNGAGKSTALKILAGISKPTSGRVAVRGKVAPLIEVGAGLVPDLTGRENIFVNATILGMKRTEIERKFEEIVGFAELEEFIDTPVKRYSSGMQIRLGFSIATSVEADILIVDEVLAVGDLAFQRKCFDRMEELIKRQGRTVLLVSHNIRQVERLCSRVVELKSGRIVAQGAPESVCNHFVQASNATIERAHGAVSSESRRDRWEVELIDVLVIDATGRHGERIACGSPCTIRVLFRCVTPLENVSFYFGIHTTDFVYLTANNTADAPRDFEPGVHRVELTFDCMTLLPGVYCILVWIGTAIGKALFSEENVAHFTVVADDFRITRQRDRAVVLLPGHWRFASERNGVNQGQQPIELRAAP